MSAARQSKYRGVYWNKARSQWESKLCAAGKKLSLGMFTEEVDAAKRYDSVLRRLLTRFNQGLNFPRSTDKIVTEEEQHRAWVLENDKGKATPAELGIVPRDQARAQRRPVAPELPELATLMDQAGGLLEMAKNLGVGGDPDPGTAWSDTYKETQDLDAANAAFCVERFGFDPRKVTAEEGRELMKTRRLSEPPSEGLVVDQEVGTSTPAALLGESEDDDDDQEFPDLSVEALMGKSA